MPGPITHASNVTMCPHGGQVQDLPTTPRVLLLGLPAALMPDQFIIAGCAFMIGPMPSPCIKVQWLVPAARVTSMGKPLLIQSSVGVCQAATQAPQGAPIIASNQTRVIAT